MKKSIIYTQLFLNNSDTIDRKKIFEIRCSDMGTVYRRYEKVQEKRQFKRTYVNLPVTLRYNGRLIPATTLNVSSGGVCLSLEEDEIFYSNRNRVEVIIDIDKEDRDVSFRGELTRIEAGVHPKVGIKFNNGPAAGSKNLSNIVDKKIH